MTKTIEFTVQQFYIMHRKPFMMQLFGSVAPLLDTDEQSLYGDTSKVSFVNFPSRFIHDWRCSNETGCGGLGGGEAGRGWRADR